MTYRNDGNISKETAEVLFEFIEANRSDFDLLNIHISEIGDTIQWAFSNEEWGLVIRLVNTGAAFLHDSFTQGKYSEWPAVVVQGLEASRRTQDREAEAKFTQFLALISHSEGALTEAEALASEALSIRKAIGDLDGETETLFLLAKIREGRDPQLAEDLHAKVIRLARKTDNRVFLIRSLYSLGELALKVGDIDGARRYYTKCLDECGGARDPRFPLDASMALYSLGITDSIRGNLRHARKHFEDARFISEAIGDTWGRVRAYYQTAKLVHADGDLDLAEKYYEMLLTFTNETGDRAMEAGIQNDLGNLLAIRGDWVGATKLLEAALETSQRLSIPELSAVVRLSLGTLAQKKGELEESAGHFQIAHQLLTDFRSESIRPLAEAYSGRLSLEMGNHNEAADMLRQSIRSSKEMKLRYPLAIARVYLALALDHQGLTHEAEKAATLGVKLMREIGDRILLVEGLRILGQVKLSANERSLAAKLLKESLVLAKKIGAVRDVQTARQMLTEIDDFT